MKAMTLKWGAAVLFGFAFCSAALTADEPTAVAPSAADLSEGFTADQKETLAERDRILALAEEWRNANEPAKALDAFQQVLALERELFGEAHAELVGTYESIAGLQETLDDYAAAVASRESVADQFVKLYGEGDFRVASARWDVKTTRRKGELDALGREAVAKITALTAQMVTLYQQNNFAEAITIADETLRLRQEVFGKEHPDCAITLTDLGVLYEAMLDYAKAASCHQRALDLRREALGEEHLDCAMNLHSLASAYQSLGDVKQAAPLYERAIAIRKKCLGEEHPDYALCLNSLGMLYDSVQDYARAEPLYRRASEIWKQTLGEEHPDYASSLNNLAGLYRATGEFGRAEPLYLQAIDIWKKLHGETHPDYARGLNNLGGLYRMMGQYVRAEPLYRQASEIWQGTLGEEHPDYAISLNNLAQLYRAMGKYTQAEPLYERALEIRRNACGEAHPLFASSVHNLAVLYDEQRNYTRAEPLYLRAMEIRQEVIGEEHPDYIASLSALAELYRATGDHTQAELYYLRLLDVRKRVWGDAHVGYAQGLLNLALLYHDMGDDARAERMLLQQNQAWQETQGEEHPMHAVGLDNLFMFHRAISDDARALPVLRRALEIRRKTLGESHPDCIQTLNVLGEAYLSSGDFTQAELVLREALENQTRLWGDDHPEFALSLNNLGQAYFRMADFARAESLHRQVIDLRARIVGKDHPAYATSLLDLANVYYSVREYARAEPLMLQALEIRKKSLGEDHPDYSQCLNNLGLLYFEMADHDRALSLFQQALAVTERIQGTRHREYATRLSNLAVLCRARSDFEQAERLALKALEIRKESLAREHPDYILSLNNLAGHYRETGDLDRAEPLAREALSAQLRALGASLAMLSEAQSLALLDSQEGPSTWLSIARELPGTKPLAAWSATWRTRGLAAAMTRQRRQALLATPETSPLVARLQTTQRQLAQLTLSIHPLAGRDGRQKRLAELNDQKESLEKQLAFVSSDFRRGQRLDRAGPGDLLKLLPPSLVVVDLARVYYYRRPREGEENHKLVGDWQYDAFIARRADGGKGIVDWVHLDLADPIDRATEKFRAELLGQPADDEQGAQGDVDRHDESPAAVLRRLVWEKLEPHFGDAREVVIIPDGSLCVLPWNALPGKEPGSYLIEEYTISTAAHGRDLLRSLTEKPEYRDRLLAAGGVDYDQRPNDAKEEALSPDNGEPPSEQPSHDQSQLLANVAPRARAPLHDPDRQLRWAELPGAAAEIAKLASLWNAERGESITLSGTTATEAAFREAAPRSRYLHLATHGFFAEAKFRSALQHDTVGEQLFGRIDAGHENKSARRGSITGRNPLLLSGVVLAGANVPPVTDELGLPTGDDGILTAEEVVSLDLRGTELVVLSACETGLGEMGGGGEGVFGLQRAFHLTGARHVVASLWKVDDAATLALMTEFYQNLWQRKQSPRVALRQAQLKMLMDFDETSSTLRAGLAEVPVDPAALARARQAAKNNPTTPRTLPPRLWAAFTISGQE